MFDTTFIFKDPNARFCFGLHWDKEVKLLLDSLFATGSRPSGTHILAKVRRCTLIFDQCHFDCSLLTSSNPSCCDSCFRVSPRRNLKLLHLREFVFVESLTLVHDFRLLAFQGFHRELSTFFTVLVQVLQEVCHFQLVSHLR